MTLPVFFTKEINDEIENIKKRNQNNSESLSQWKRYLGWIVQYISNSPIAWDYAGIYVHNSEGVIFFDSFGYSLSYIVRIDEETTQAFVSIINIDLNTKEFGLMEYWHKLGAQIITESKLQRIISESIRKVLFN